MSRYFQILCINNLTGEKSYFVGGNIWADDRHLAHHYKTNEETLKIAKKLKKYNFESLYIQEVVLGGKHAKNTTN